MTSATDPKNRPANTFAGTPTDTLNDTLITSYHAAQAALQADDLSTTTAGPSAAVRARILAHAAQLAQEEVKHENSSNATILIARNSIPEPLKGQFDHKKSAVNDSLWNVRALASIAVLGISSLLFLLVGRGTPEEKEIAFGTAGPAPQVALPSAASPASPTPITTLPASPSAKISDTATPIAQPVTPPAAAPDNPSSERTTSRKPKAATSPQSNATMPKMDAAVTPATQSMPELLSAPMQAPAAPAMTRAPAPAESSGASAISEFTSSNRADRAQSKPAAASGAMQKNHLQNGADSAKPLVPNELLLSAIRLGDAVALQQALQSGANKNAKFQGTPALSLCVQQGHLDLLELLMAAGADVNAADAQGITPLGHAQALGKRLFINRLQAHGAQ